MLPYLLIALSTLVSEDLTCIATGLLIAQHRFSFTAGTAACAVGIFGGDLLLVLAGRYASFLRLKTSVPLEILKRRTNWILYATRFMPGMRFPVYVGAGLLRIPLRQVTVPLLAGSAVWTPILVGLAVAFGATFVTTGLKALQFLVITFVLIKVLSSYERRRKLVGFIRRKTHWEFWPVWATYAPVIPYILWLGIKHRCFTLFTAANPDIPLGGLTGESKAVILAHLNREKDMVARSALLPAALSVDAKLAIIERFGFPTVLKPDVGERGRGVAIVRSAAEARSYVTSALEDLIVQEYVGGLEYGVFYCRYPNESCGHITSITDKQMPMLVGDGTSSLERLILADSRACVLYKAYAAGLKDRMAGIPAAGERVQLVEIGSHCRGSIFLNATSLCTPELDAAIERVSQAHPGFYYGRFDLKAESVEAFREGRFKVLELNGVGAEPAHIYDPAVSLWEAYRVLFSHWRAMFEIGAANREAGAAPASVRELLRNTNRQLVPVQN